MKLKPFGVMLGILGNLMIILALHELIGLTDCGIGCQPDGVYVAMVPLGIIVSMAAIFFGGTFVTFLGLFLSVGVGSLWAGFDLPAGSEQKSFAFVFGGIFAAVPLLLVLLSLVGLKKTAGKAQLANQLVTSGGKAIGTVTEVRDTGVTINNDPRVEVTMRLEPEDGTAPFDATKTVTVSRVDLPRRGDRFPAWYDRTDPANWAYGTDMDPTQVAPDVRAMFDKAAVPEDDPASALEKLAALHASGALTDAEFAAAKAKVLAT